MKYTEKLIKDNEFLAVLKEIEEVEKTRIYCRHTLPHLLDVCRIAWIIRLERKAGAADTAETTAQKDLYYLTGLLHDIGRAEQAKTGEDHKIAGTRIAQRILNRTGCPPDWQEQIIRTIQRHGRRSHPEEISQLEADIIAADQISRNCFVCKASDSCKWHEDEKNQSIRF